VGRPGDDGPPLDPTSTGRLGTKAVVTLLEELGAEVDITESAPGAGTDVALLLAGDIPDDQVAPFTVWLQNGGVLVVADPGSPLTPEVVGQPFGGLVEATISQASCDVAALRDVARVDPVGGVAYAVGEGDQSCFGDGESAFVVVHPQGQGTIVAVGGAAVFTNHVLDHQFNAVLAAGLLVPTGGERIALLRPPAPGAGEKSLSELISSNVKRALIQLAVAFCFYAAWRAIRLGRPVTEPQPVQIAGSELVSAVGNLLQQGRSPERAASILRSDLQRSVAQRLGIPRDLPPDAFAAAASARLTTDPATVQHALAGPPVGDDEELIALTRSIDTVRQEVLHAPPVRQR
jgi:hypothetical protein